MTSVVAVAAAALALGGLYGEKGNGTIKEESRQVADFTGVEVGGGIEAKVSVGSEKKVTIEADENLLPLIATTVKDGVLRIQPNNVRPTKAIQVTVVTPKLERVSGSGGVEMRVKAAPSKKFVIEGSGGTELYVTGLDADELVVDLSGGVEAKLSGKARQADYEFSGGVNVDARSLEAEDVKLDASGGVDARIAASKAVAGEASGGVAVKVKGRPTMKVDSSGGSSVQTE